MLNRFPSTGLSWLLVTLVAFLPTGCNDSQEKKPPVQPVPAKPSGPIRVLVVDDQPLAEGIERRWQAQAEGEIQVQPISWQQLLELKTLDADVVIYPSGRLGGLAERKLIAPLPESVLKDSQADRRDIFPLVRFQVVGWGEQIYAVPLGSPQLTLYYRADIFQQLDLLPPTTWAEYQKLAVLLSQRDLLGKEAPPADQPWHGTIEPLGPGWASQVLLARVAAYARTAGRYSTLFDYRSMKPLVDGPAFVRALEELAASSKQANDFSPHDARSEFFAGRCAMALSWPSRTGDVEQENRSTDFRVGLAELPGSPEAFHVTTDDWQQKPANQSPHVPLLAVAGRLGSVVEGTRNVRSARNFLFWLSSKDRGSEISTFSSATTMFRNSHLTAASQWVESDTVAAADQYADVVNQAQSRNLWLFSVRISGRDEYLAALDQAVHRAISGKESAAESLTKAVKQWSEINEKYGIDAQRHAYQRSLGLEP